MFIPGRIVTSPQRDYRNKMSSEIIDLDVLNELKEIMEDDFDELIETFIADGQKQLDALRVAIDASIVPDIRRIAHTLKGSSANLGANALSETCKVLEHDAAEDNLGDVNKQYEKIRNAYEAVKGFLSREFLIT